MALSVDIRFYLRQWEGSYTLEWQGGDAAVVRFEKEADLKGERLGNGGLACLRDRHRGRQTHAALPAVQLTRPIATRARCGQQTAADRAPLLT